MDFLGISVELIFVNGQILEISLKQIFANEVISNMSREFIFANGQIFLSSLFLTKRMEWNALDWKKKYCIKERIIFETEHVFSRLSNWNLLN